MLHRARRHLTYANVVSTLCLFIVLGGTAYAAATIGSAQIVDDSIRSVDVRNEASSGGGLTGADIRNNTLRRGDLGVTMRHGSQGRGPMDACAYGPAYEDCATTQITLPRPQRLLAVASGRIGTGSTDVTVENCVIEVDNNGDLGPVGHFQATHWETFSLHRITGIVAAGSHRVDLTCRRLSGNGVVRDSELSVIAVGDG